MTNFVEKLFLHFCCTEPFCFAPDDEGLMLEMLAKVILRCVYLTLTTFCWWNSSFYVLVTLTQINTILCLERHSYSLHTRCMNMHFWGILGSGKHSFKDSVRFTTCFDSQSEIFISMLNKFVQLWKWKNMHSTNHNHIHFGHICVYK